MATAFLAEKTVRVLLGVSKSTLQRWASEGRGPARKKIGPHKVGYDAREVEAFCQSLPNVGDNEAKVAA